MFQNGGNAGTYENHKDLVVIYHSLARDVPQVRLWDYANKIYLAEKTIDQNINGQKTPYILGVTKKNLSTIQRFFSKLMSFEDAIYLSQDLRENAIQKTDLVTPYVAGDVFDMRKNWYNEAMAYIGIVSPLIVTGKLHLQNS